MGLEFGVKRAKPFVMGKKLEIQAASAKTEMVAWRTTPQTVRRIEAIMEATGAKKTEVIEQVVGWGLDAYEEAHPPKR